MLLLTRYALSNTQIFLCNQRASETKASGLGDYFCASHPLKMNPNPTGFTNYFFFLT